MSFNTSIVRQVDIIPTSELISEVQKYRALWDQNVEEYQEKAARDEAWKKVVTAFFPDQLPAIERIEIETMIKKKWKSIRTCYARELLRIKTGEGRRRKRYMHYDQLRFLNQGAKNKTDGDDNSEISAATPKQSFQPFRNTLSSTSQATDQTITSSKACATHENKEEEEEEEERNLPTISRPSVPRTRVLKRPRQDIRIIKGTSNKKRLVGSRDSESFSTDKMFLMSLVPDLQKVDESLKLRVKLDIMKTIMSAQEESINLAIIESYDTCVEEQEYERENSSISHYSGQNKETENSVSADETKHELSFVKIEALENPSSTEDPEDSMDYDGIFLV